MLRTLLVTLLFMFFAYYLGRLAGVKEENVRLQGKIKSATDLRYLVEKQIEEETGCKVIVKEINIGCGSGE